ncbi:NADH:flavin oxidoreductase [Ahrensia marina]|uniref:Oxidoreductase n=1 Tax=Ahrensia marina TaxID=1514904 RepID=A0A0N0E6S7_9HYPH|nr:NADH:flavin oxidoreductase [Ahrensia marina]KPB00375.1 oxidoreductase [Ahrensia marina]
MSQTHPVLTKSAIRKLDIGNRLVLAPMSRASAQDDGVPTKNMANYYSEFAKGGYGLLIAEGAFTDNKFSQSYSNQPGMVTDEHQSGWREVTEKVKAHDGRIILQLIHAGALSQHVDRPHAPSAVRPQGNMLQGYGHKQGEYPIPEILSLQDVEEIKRGFLQASLRAQEAGFDGVEIHCANGYLLDQFLTDDTNKRDDQYGGSLENRIRLTCEIIRDARQNAPDDFIVGVRLSQAKANNSDYFWPNGIADAEIIFGSVANAGADYIHLASEKNGYAYHSYTKDNRNLTEYARELTGLPVIANGGMQDIELANSIIADSKADFVSIGKTAMINPDLPKKVASNNAVQDFTFDMFKFGVSIEAQQKWQVEAKN